MPSRLRLCAMAFSLVLAAFGCQPAVRYSTAPIPANTRREPPPTQSKPASPDPPSRSKGLPPDLLWMEPSPNIMERPVPILFRTEADHPDEWNKLKGFWNVGELPGQQIPLDTAVAVVAGSPILAAGLTTTFPSSRAVIIKVPLGLDDPTPSIPPSNPPTLAKWELGKRLFFDPTLVSSRNRRGCVGCHQPAKGFTDPTILYPRNPPTLINSVYNKHQFWDGRVRDLEEVAPALEDQPALPDVRPDDRHAWPGMVERLRASPEYVAQFRRAFGTPPTQDALGKALATYMRTILVGNSLHDRAAQHMRKRGGKTIEAADYEQVLDEPAIKFLLSGLDDPRPKTDVAQQLFSGHTLFHGKEGCVQCHHGSNFTDNSFHNIGEGDSSATPQPGQETGRFAVLPPGLKDRRMIGAYKTPTLRALPRTKPYLHDGLRDELFEVIGVHVRPVRLSPYLDPAIYDRKLTEGEMRALTVFLRALDGEALPAEVAEPAKGPK
jgi:cytochrome c peroxidase